MAQYTYFIKNYDDNVHTRCGIAWGNTGYVVTSSVCLNLKKKYFIAYNSKMEMKYLEFVSKSDDFGLALLKIFEKENDGAGSSRAASSSSKGKRKAKEEEEKKPIVINLQEIPRPTFPYNSEIVIRGEEIRAWIQTTDEHEWFTAHKGYCMRNFDPKRVVVPKTLKPILTVYGSYPAQATSSTPPNSYPNQRMRDEILDTGLSDTILLTGHVITSFNALNMRMHARLYEDLNPELPLIQIQELLNDKRKEGGYWATPVVHNKCGTVIGLLLDSFGSADYAIPISIVNRFVELSFHAMNQLTRGHGGHGYGRG